LIISDGSFKSIILGLVKNHRTFRSIYNTVNANESLISVRAYYETKFSEVLDDAVSLKMATLTRNESIFINIFTTRPFHHILALQYQFTYMYKRNLINVLNYQFPSDAFQVYKYILQSSENHIRFLATQFHIVLDRYITDYSTLSRLIVNAWRKSLLRDVKEEYFLHFKRNLLDDCEKKRIGGDYGKMVYALILHA
jgi:hypothetical protein